MSFPLVAYLLGVATVLSGMGLYLVLVAVL